MSQFFYDGKFYAAGTMIVGPDNRGLRYGDGLFETMKAKNAKIILLEEHLSRFWAGIELLEFELPAFFTKEIIGSQLLALLQKNQHRDARVRLTALRGNGGLYDPETLRPHLVMQSWPFNPAVGINENGLQISIYRGAVKPCDQFSNLKHNNFLCYLMGAIFAKKNKYNDAVILNQHGRICDSTIANIFMIKNGKVYTPSLTEGCVAGILRQYLLHRLPALGISITEKEVTEEMLMDADEIFLSNSMSNLKWVSSVNDKKFKAGLTREIYHMLLSTNDGVFC